MALPVVNQKSAGSSAVWTRIGPQHMQKESPSNANNKLCPERQNPPASTTGKRTRPVHDVDGPFTGSLSCKKRRLRRELITSRLSRPFSSPATHILNRETATGGDIFLRRAAKTTASIGAQGTRTCRSSLQSGVQSTDVISTRKLHGHEPAELVHRVAVLNRIRRRYDDEVKVRSEPAIDAPHQSGFFDAPVKTKTGPCDAPAEEDISFSRPGPREDPRARTTSSRSSRSPELRAMRAQTATTSSKSTSEDPAEDDSLSFPISSYIEDSADVEDIYADFGVIFGAHEDDEDSSARERDLVASAGTGTGTLRAAECLEDYMDDVDGIPFEAR